MIHEDPTGANHDLYSDGLKKALYNYMHSIEIERPVDEWFEFKIPKTSHKESLIEFALYDGLKSDWETQNYSLLWNGVPLSVVEADEEEDFMTFSINTKKENVEFELSYDLGEWLYEIFPLFDLNNENKTMLKMIAHDFEEQFEVSFEEFVDSDIWEILRTNGLLMIRF